MFIVRAAVLVAVVASGSGVVMAAELDNLSIQKSSRFGQRGDISTLSFERNKPGYFFVTGRFNDTATVRFAGGSFSKSIRQLWNRDSGALEVIERTQLDDGRSRVLLKIDSVQPNFNGGSVTLTSDRGVVIDSDPIVVR